VNVLVPAIVWLPVSFTTVLSSALAFNAVASAVLSDGCHARLANDTVFQWFIWSNQTLPS
jgi:hypothetical protein